MRLSATLLLLSCATFAQNAEGSLTFEVASVKPHTGNTTGERPRTAQDPGRLVMTNRLLRSMIIEAFGIRNFQLEHPAWMGENRYDLVAKVPEGATKEQQQIMLRNLLAERFHLQVRRETRNLAALALILGKGEPKLTRNDSAPDPDVGIKQSVRNGIITETARQQSLAKFVTWLTGALDRPVLNETGVTGNYDFSMSWSLDTATSDADLHDALISAVQQQLGLKLESRKAPVEMLVVVSALKVPLEN
jgi:uncharacterized protein (TIGR03435 family)